MSGILEALMKGGQTMLSGAENLGGDVLSGVENLGSNFLQNTGLMSADPSQAIAAGGTTPGGWNAQLGSKATPDYFAKVAQQQKMQQFMRKLMLSQMMGQLGGGQQGGMGSQLPLLMMMLNQGGMP